MPRLLDVWAAPCDKCHAEVNRPCRDMRAVHRVLFGRRTHAERRRAVRAMGSPKLTRMRPPTQRRDREVRMANFVPTGITYATGDEWHQVAYNGTTTGVYVQTMNTTTASDWATVDLTMDGVWMRWADNHGTITMPANAERLYREWVAHDEDRDERRRREAEREEARRDALQRMREEENARRLRAAQRLAAQEDAQNTALELFRSLLTPEQAEEWEGIQQVTVRGSAGGIYRIDGTMDSIHGNVVQIDEHGCHLRRLCFAPQMYEGDYWRDENVLPMADGWVGQLMAIRHDEEGVLRVANPSQIRRCTYPRERAA